MNPPRAAFRFISFFQLKTLKMRSLLTFFVVFISITASLSAQTSPQKAVYAVVSSAETFADPAWEKSAQALEKKYAERFNVQRVEIPALDADEEALKAFVGRMRELMPYYSCFLLRPEELGETRVRQINQFTRVLNDDPYTDTIWGIITGFTPEDALRVASCSEPLTVRRVAGISPMPLEIFESGVWYDEGRKNHYVEKTVGPDGNAVITDHTDGPGDTTRALAEAWKGADLFLTSAHATSHDWQPGYTYRNGCFRSKNGEYLACPLKGEPFPVTCDGPKVHIAAGNCLIGNVDDRDCMVLAEFHSLGVNAFVGYTVPTWFGYMGWGVLEYYLGQPGQFTCAEAFFASNQALTYRLMQLLPELTTAESKEEIQKRFNELSNDQKRDVQGLLYDRDTVAFYGDPAWESRLAPPQKGTFWAQELTKKPDGGWTLSVSRKTVEAQNQTGDPGNAGETRDAANAGSSGRPLVQILPPEAVGETVDGPSVVKGRVFILVEKTASN